jgi:hypothetical protein
MSRFDFQCRWKQRPESRQTMTQVERGIVFRRRMTAATVTITIAALSIALGACRQEPVAPLGKTQRDPVDLAQAPDCSGVDQWPTTMAFAHLKNAGITDNERLDFARTKTTLLASEQIKDGLFRQIHHVAFREISGHAIDVVTVNDASNDECSMSGVDVYVIDRHLGPN